MNMMPQPIQQLRCAPLLISLVTLLLAYPDALLRQPDPGLLQCWADLLYFSFVTLTSLGSGDFAPVSSQARGLTIIEAVTGILYAAVFVAWLVGLYRMPPDAGEADDG